MTKLTAKVRNAIPAGKFAFRGERKMPLENAAHVRNAISRFNQVKGVTDAERDIAWRRIFSAAKQYGVDMKESGWRHMVP
jgi:hypothetical protein